MRGKYRNKPEGIQTVHDILRRIAAAVVVMSLCVMMAEGSTRNVVVADSVTRMPLPSASVFDRNGNTVGITDMRGRIPYISPESYPVTVRYLGFSEKTVSPFVAADTVFLQENIPELPEVIVESSRHRVLHMLAYVREYSTLSTYTDTVFLFREKMADYMLTPDKRVRFKGWSSPRLLACRSYYRFTDARGRDSVSNVSNHHFSWSDWIGTPPASVLPHVLAHTESGSDTIRGKYSATEIWTRNNSRVIVDVDVMADTNSRKWVPNLAGFFRNDLEFERFRVRFNYDNVAGDTVAPSDLTGYSYNIESNGRGHDMFMFNRVGEPFFVSTYAEVYMLDKEYITVKEAKKWDARKFDMSEIGIFEPPEAPALQPSIQELVDRVNNIDIDMVRLDIVPDQNLVSKNFGKKRSHNIGRRVLALLKDVTGISGRKMNRNLNRQWDELKKERRAKKNPRREE